MTTVIAETAKAKVNLALHVLGRRADGYHAIDSVVAFASVADGLEVSVAAAGAPGVTLAVAGPFAVDVPVDDSNLICRAYALLAAHVDLPPVRVKLDKNLPVAAGIGGGSADAAAALRAFLKLAAGTVDPQIVRDIALKLGADVPVCLHLQACRMEGVGEILSPLLQLPAAAIVLVNPGVPCETAGVFAALGLGKGQHFGEGLDPHLPVHWRNDLTAAALAVQPVIKDVLTVLQTQAGLSPVRMSGSGATCFGLAQSIGAARRAATAVATAHPEWWVVAAELS